MNFQGDWFVLKVEICTRFYCFPSKELANPGC